MTMENLKFKILVCKKCWHKWIPRYNRLPKVCPECKRTDWNGDSVEKYIKAVEEDKLDEYHDNHGRG